MSEVLRPPQYRTRTGGLGSGGGGPSGSEAAGGGSAIAADLSPLSRFFLAGIVMEGM